MDEIDALVMVDVQRDFLPGGALGVEHGDEVIPELARLARHARLVVATKDWHTPHDASFVAQGGPWPVHCVAGTAGAELAPAIEGLAGVVVTKPTNDATAGTDLVDRLHAASVTTITVGGLALDFCVRETALGLARAGFRVTVDRAASRAVTAEGAAAAEIELTAAGITLG